MNRDILTVFVEQRPYRLTGIDPLNQRQVGMEESKTLIKAEIQDAQGGPEPETLIKIDIAQGHINSIRRQEAPTITMLTSSACVMLRDEARGLPLEM